MYAHGCRCAIAAVHFDGPGIRGHEVKRAVNIPRKSNFYPAGEGDPFRFSGFEINALYFAVSVQPETRAA